MRRNALNWLCGQFKDASHAVILTHNIDFLFVQSVLLPKLRLAGSPRLTIFADANSAAGTYREQISLIDGLGIRYRVVPVDLGPMRRFHAKAILLCNPQRAMCAIGSGNLTHGGMSANHEVWTFADSAGEKASILASLRTYIQAIADTLPLGEAVRDDISAVFDTEDAWIADLPAPSGLLTSPSDRPLLEQIADLVGDEIRAVSVLTPYFDPEGKALAELHRRFKAPITVSIQPGREGLSAKAAEKLPKGIALKTVDCLEGNRPSFIHAKVFAFHRLNDVMLAVGSANCSQAALLATENWGNAELMALESLTPDAFAEFMGDIVESDELPNLPPDPPSDEWESEIVTFRILAARKDGATLEIAYKSVTTISNLTVEAFEGTWRSIRVDNERGVAVFHVPIKVRWVELIGQATDGKLLRSEKAWVDDEASLSAPASLRRVFRRLQDSEASVDSSPESFRAVLDQFRDYLRDPEVSRRKMHRGEKKQQQPAPYDPADVFSDNFGRSSGSLSNQGDQSQDQQNILGIIEAIFSLSSGAGRGGVSEPPTEDGEEPDPEAEEEKIIKRSSAKPSDKTAAQLRRALDGIEAALIDPSFVTARRPELLGADITLAAILLVKGLADGHLEFNAYRETTKILWTHLFFGPHGNGDGSIKKRMDELDAAARDQFIIAIATPKLSAALALWSLPEWQASDPAALWFRMSACQLQHRAPWLFSSAPPEVVMEELERQAALMPPSLRAEAIGAWINMIRGGEALRQLFNALTPIPHVELARMVTSLEVSPQDLLWQAKSLAFPTHSYRRDASTRAEVLVLGDSAPRKFKGDHLVPVSDLLEQEFLKLHPRAIEEIKRFVNIAGDVRGCSIAKRIGR
jgi:hypothetical protein